jgi:hypothetical protein
MEADLETQSGKDVYDVLNPMAAHIDPCPVDAVLGCRVSH